MAAVKIDYNISPPVYLALLPSDTPPHVSGCQVIDVEITHSSPPTIDRIVFRNYYTHTISIKYHSADESSSLPWKHCLREKTLMSSCHCEEGSQDWFSFKLTTVGDEGRVKNLRLVLRQPSCNWNEFSIRDLTIYSIVPIATVPLSPLTVPPRADKMEDNDDYLNTILNKMVQVTRKSCDRHV